MHTFLILTELPNRSHFHLKNHQTHNQEIFLSIFAISRCKWIWLIRYKIVIVNKRSKNIFICYNYFSNKKIRKRNTMYYLNEFRPLPVVHSLDSQHLSSSPINTMHMTLIHIWICRYLTLTLSTYFFIIYFVNVPGVVVSLIFFCNFSNNHHGMQLCSNAPSMII